jgi:HSP20 family molecular chaperone IbpA
MNEISLFESLSKTIDRVFHDNDWFLNLVEDPIVSFIYDGVPIDIVLKENRDMEITAAVAGYPESNISIDFDGDYMLISISKIEKEKKEKYICRGIKKSGAKVKIFIPNSRFKQDETKASLKDGLLKITIPSKEEAKLRKIPINKN